MAPIQATSGGGEEAEAILDVTWSGSIASGANIAVRPLFLHRHDRRSGPLSQYTSCDNDLGDVMTESFGICEQHVTNAELSRIQFTCPAGCRSGDYLHRLHGGYWLLWLRQSRARPLRPARFPSNALASTPFNVAVGGTIFNENGQDSTVLEFQPGLVTALKYIPEKVWNESCTSSARAATNANIAAGGGGPKHGCSPSLPGRQESSSAHSQRWLPRSSRYLVHCGRARPLPDLLSKARAHSKACYSASAERRRPLPHLRESSPCVDQKVGGRVGSANYALV